MRGLNHFRLFGRALQMVERARHAVPLLKMETRLLGMKAKRDRTTIEAKL